MTDKEKGTKPTRPSAGALRAANKVLNRLYPKTTFDRHRTGAKPTALAAELAQIIHDKTKQDAMQGLLSESKLARNMLRILKSDASITQDIAYQIELTMETLQAAIQKVEEE